MDNGNLRKSTNMQKYTFYSVFSDSVFATFYSILVKVILHLSTFISSSNIMISIRMMWEGI